MNAENNRKAKHSSYEPQLERANFIARLRSLAPSGSESDVARRAGISAGGLRGALAKGNPGRELIARVARSSGVTVGWLAAGEEPRTPGERQEIREEASDYGSRVEMRVAWPVAEAVRSLSIQDEEERLAISETLVRVLDAIGEPSRVVAALDYTRLTAIAAAIQAFKLSQSSLRKPGE